MREYATEKTGYKYYRLFFCYFVRMPQIYVFFYIRGNGVFPTVQITVPVFSVSGFHEH